MKQRLDLLLVERKLADSRRVAQALIMSGRVTVDGLRADKAGMRVGPESELVVAGPPSPFVSRGGVKLSGALDDFGLEVEGLTALDVGASTGGFTDCLLKRGASRVFAIDVGHGQIDWSLRNDPRVEILEGINARYLSPDDLPSPVDIAVIDVSFISLRHILPRIAPVVRVEKVVTDPPTRAAGRGSIVALVKPQFEVGRGLVGRGGIVRSREMRLQAVDGLAMFAASLGLGVAGLARSRLAGAEGNQEYFLHLWPGGGGLTPAEIRQKAAEITSEEEDAD